MRLRTKLGVSLATVAFAGVAAVTAIEIGVGGAAGAATRASGGTWGSVQDIPGLAALVRTGTWTNPSEVKALGCSTLGNCVAVGHYAPLSGSGSPVPFVATEVGGTWHDAQPVTGLPALAIGTTASLTGVACGTPDFCTAFGSYDDASNAPHIFVITETGGTWGTLTVLDPSGLGSVESISAGRLVCPAPGECTLIGSYTPNSMGAIPNSFTADESAGAWGTLQPLAGLASLQPGPSTVPAVQGGLSSLSCSAPGDCTAGGIYDYGEVDEPFVVTESGHVWGPPQPIPSLAALTPGGQYSEGPGNYITSVSCPDVGDCAVVGNYFPQLNSGGLVYTLDEVGGVWGQAKVLSIPPGDVLRSDEGFRVSCRSAGDCVMTGTVSVISNASREAITAAEASAGSWGAATAIPGIASGEEGIAFDVACVPGGDCTILGTYAPGGRQPIEVFSATSTADGGTPGAAQPVLSTGGGAPLDLALACPRSGHCTVTYTSSAIIGTLWPQMVTEATPASVTLATSAAKVTYGAEQSATLTATASSPAGGTPTGTVTVTGPGGSTVCTMTLASGTGTCPLTAKQLPAGTDALTAAYGGDATYLPASGTGTVTVAQAATVTRLAFTPRSITFTGAATTLAVTGSVSSTAGTPNGWVTVRVDGKPVSGCGNAPFTGTVSCRGATAILAGGKHLVTLAYSGRGDFAASASAPLPLTVAKRGTTTALALAKVNVTYGHESAGKFTVSVTRAGGVYPTGKVAVRIGGTTICTITLSKGTGGCTLANTRLPVGTYSLVALYSGDGSYSQSASVKKTLRVAA
jgi:hypothetical protein